MQKSAIGLKNFIAILAVIFILMLLNSWSFLQRPKNTILKVLSPIESVFSYPSGILNDFLRTIKDIGNFKSENERLQAENRNLYYQLSKLQETQKENESLKNQLDFKNNLCGGNDCISLEEGRIISRSPESYGGYILIDLGSKDGAFVGQAVTIQKGIMIGKISEVFDSYSKVMLVISPESSVNCITQATPPANGLVRGKYGTSARLEMIDQSEQLNIGDIVITSGLESGIPKGLVLGKISAVEQSPNMVFKAADIQLFGDFSHIEEVFLVKTK